MNLNEIRAELTHLHSASSELLADVLHVRPSSRLMPGRLHGQPKGREQRKGGRCLTLDEIMRASTASPVFTSWNQINGWLRQVDGLRPLK